jgi:hypothetical protein
VREWSLSSRLHAATGVRNQSVRRSANRPGACDQSDRSILRSRERLFDFAGEQGAAMRVE